ncbi:MAG: hypothetical protein JST08_00505 [Actinobacteria bacterium]|nr:hypothetical protein [Actinomycetota bacterium]
MAPSDGQIERPVSLRFVGDWGGANLTRVCGWLAHELHERSGGGVHSWIRTGDAGIANLEALGRAEVDVAVVTPSAIAALATRGLGPFAGRSYPFLRAIGELPHPDRLLLAIRRDLGVESVEDLRERQLPLRLATSTAAGGSFAGYAAEWLLDAAGIPLAAIREWGGEVIDHDAPFACIAELEAGNADAVLHEAVMTPWWQTVAAKVPLSFISFAPELLARAEAELCCPPDTIPAGYMPGMEADVETVEFRGYLVVAREEMASDVAGLLAWILAETAEQFIAMNYRHIPADRAPIHYPVTREGLSHTPIPLHPGAADYYREAAAAAPATN